MRPRMCKSILKEIQFRSVTSTSWSLHRGKKRLETKNSDEKYSSELGSHLDLEVNPNIVRLGFGSSDSDCIHSTRKQREGISLTGSRHSGADGKRVPSEGSHIGLGSAKCESRRSVRKCAVCRVGHVTASKVFPDQGRRNGDADGLTGSTL